MKYVSAIHVTVKPILKTWKFLWFGRFLYFFIKKFKLDKVTVFFDCKDKRDAFASCIIGRDITLHGRGVSKVKTAELVYPWDKLFLAMVRYRGSLIKQATNEDINRYGKAGRN